MRFYFFFFFNWNGYTFEDCNRVDRQPVRRGGTELSGVRYFRAAVVPVGVMLVISLFTGCGPSVKLKQPETALPESYGSDSMSNLCLSLKDG